MENISCPTEVPLALDCLKSLDTFGILLRSGLTLMAFISLVVYTEEVVYFFKKFPNPKKTSIIWVTGAAPVIGAVACIGMWIPRSTLITDLTSASYFAIVIHKFLIMMIEECGGDDEFLERCGSDPLKISTGPCCCCCPCLPYPRITRRTLFWLKLGTFQFALLRLVFTFLSIVLWTNGNFDAYDLSITCATIWINPFVGILTIIALWPVGIMFKHLAPVLKSKNIIAKYALHQSILILSQLQASIINILAMNGVIACSPPFSSNARGTAMNQQLLIIEMFIITLTSRAFYRRRYEELNSVDQHEEDNQGNAKIQLNGPPLDGQDYA
ncbi:organic solute transporter subunit alpha [Erpetoichthys calabaricus]|uniref:Solute carrier family 51 member A n=1 Tax=Erpetoichthys calabaricus TaxID=27687 RepID=A0A8C4RYF1_ERPCA|nr:organic solute transporter subunit alpha [Erpetoichthys calabaricus]